MATRSSNISRKINQAILVKAKGWAKDIETIANSTPGKPTHVKAKATAQMDAGVVNINARGLSPKGDARAYEYGSGIHSRLPNLSKWQDGSRGYIIITPKKRKLLAFQWELMDNMMEEFGVEAVREALQYSHKFKGFADDGRYLFKFVEHPGVEAANGGKGYLSPAIAKVRAKIRREIPKEVRDVIVGDITRSFRKTRGTKESSE